MEMIDNLMQKILQHFAGPHFQEELAQAKVEFFEHVKILEDNVELYEQRMSQFYDWYFFIRELSGFGQPPIKACHFIRELRFSPEELEILSVLEQNRHSIFEFIKLKDKALHIKDLIRKDKIVVKDNPWTFGFDGGEFFEARLINWQGEWLFTKGFCFHPGEAKKFILMEVKKYQKNPDLDIEDFLLRLAKKRFKLDQYKHVKPELIYAQI